MSLTSLYRRTVVLLLLSLASCITTSSHTAFAAAPGTLLSCGKNEFGTLGEGTVTDRYHLGPVSDLSNITLMATRGSHALAVKSDGSMWAWGDNRSGQLGIGTTGSSFYGTPVQSASLSGVASLGAGNSHSVALKNDGTVWVWGSNSMGQLGDGGSSRRSLPFQLSSLSGITAIAVGSGHSLALKSNGTVWAWGANTLGQLGDGTTTTRTSPVAVTGLSGVIAISAGSNHGLALKNDGTVWAWGYNSNGQLGDNTTTTRTTPVQVSGLTGVTAITAGSTFNFVRRKDGSGNISWWGWGTNSSGQLADGTIVSRKTPVLLSGLNDVISIVAGDAHCLALRSNGTVLSWGDNYYGALCDPTTITQTTPTPLIGITAALSIAAGGDVSLITVANANDGLAMYDDTAVCKRDSATISINVLGNDYNVQGAVLSVASATSAAHGTVAVNGNAVDYTPQTGYIGSDSFTYTATDVLGNSHTASVTVWIVRQGSMVAWGNNNYGQLGSVGPASRLSPAPLNGMMSVIAMSGGDHHTIALRSEGTVWACGRNGRGQLGDGSSVTTPVPVQVSGLSGIIAIDAGDEHNLAIKSDGTVWAWGENDKGQLGDGTTTLRRIPVQVNGLNGIVAISASGGHSLAVKNDGTVWAWGWNYFGQLGDGTTSDRLMPVQVVGLSGVSKVAAGGLHSLALKSNGTVWACGSNSAGQLGDNTNTTTSLPVQALGITNATSVAAGYEFSLARKSDGTVWAWGINANYELGNGVDYDNELPGPVVGLSGVGAIDAGSAHGLAFKSPNSIWGWGFNATGQIGDTTVGQHPWAVAVLGLNDVTSIAAGFYHGLACIGTAILPAAANDSFIVEANTGANALSVLSNDAANTPDPLGIVGITQGAHGTVALTGSGASGATGLTYTPTSGYSGSDSFTYTVSNGEGVSIATVSLSVQLPSNIGGRVTLSNGNGLPNVSISLSPAPNGVTNPLLTNASGDYNFMGVPPGTYTVKPTIANYSFNPVTLSVTAAGANISGQNFIAYPWVSVTGTIRNSSAVGVAGVSVSLSPPPAGIAATVVSNSNGVFLFPKVPPGTYVLLPTKSGSSFNPYSRSITVGTTNLINLNFAAGVGYGMAGRVSWSSGAAMANVRVTCVGNGVNIVAYTSGAGYFTFAGLPNGTYQITPSLAPYSMQPGYQMVTINGASVSGINFSGGYTINGRVYTSTGAALVNASLLRTGSPYPIYTNSAGYFTFAGVAPGTYTITPTVAGYGFAPQTRTVTVTDTNVVNANFLGASGYKVVGRIVTSAGAPLPNVSVTRSGSTITAVTNSSGYYTFNGVTNGSYTITPSLSGKTFAPVSRSVTVSGADVIGQNFTGS